MWGALWHPERWSTHGSNALPLLQCRISWAGWSPLLRPARCGVASSPKVMHQSAAGLWHPFTALLFVICIISAVIMLENGCFFLNKRKVPARISRIKACLAGNQCRVLKAGRAAEPSTELCVPGEQCFSSPEQRLLLWYQVRWTSHSPHHCKQWQKAWPALQTLVFADHNDNQPYVWFSHPYDWCVSSASSSGPAPQVFFLHLYLFGDSEN